MGITKMKFFKKFNLLSLFIAVTILMTLLSTIESRRRSKRIPNPHPIVQKGGECYQAIKGEVMKKCADGLVCTQPKKTVKGGKYTCQPKMKGVVVQEGGACYQAIKGAEKKRCAHGLVCTQP